MDRPATRLRRFTHATVVAAVLVASGASAQTTPIAPDRPADAASTSWLGGAVSQVASDFASLPSLENAFILGTGAAASIAANETDRHVEPQLRGGDYEFLDAGSLLGDAGVQVGIAVGTYGIGRFIGSSRTAVVGRDLLRAQVLVQSITLGLKVAVGRSRPGSTDRRSFPSGHASTSFATATVLARHVGWPLRIPLFIGASYVGASRLHDHQHFFSDVVFGSALGIAAGRTATRTTHSAMAWSLVPTDGGLAIVFSRR